MRVQLHIMLFIAAIGLTLNQSSYGDQLQQSRQLAQAPGYGNWNSDGLPPGSYNGSCHSCTVASKHVLMCICQYPGGNQQTSIDINTCLTWGPYSVRNDNGNLRCGN